MTCFEDTVFPASSFEEPFRAHLATEAAFGTLVAFFFAEEDFPVVFVFVEGTAGDCFFVFYKNALISLLALLAWLAVFVLIIVIASSLTLVFIYSLETLEQALLEILRSDAFEEV